MTLKCKALYKIVCMTPTIDVCTIIQSEKRNGNKGFQGTKGTKGRRGNFTKGSRLIFKGFSNREVMFLSFPNNNIIYYSRKRHPPPPR